MFMTGNSSKGVASVLFFITKPPQISDILLKKKLEMCPLFTSLTPKMQKSTSISLKMRKCTKVVLK